MRELLFWGMSLFYPGMLFGQTPNCQFSVPFTSATRSNAFPAQSTPTGAPCVSWRVTYQASNMSAVSLSFQGSPDNGAGAPTGSWTTLGGSCPASNPCTINVGTNPMTDTAESNLQVAGYYPWVSLNMATFTGTGSVVVKVFGYTGTSAMQSGISQLSGDGSAGPGSGLQQFTLTTVNSSPGACGDSSHVCEVTTNGKGLVTSQTTVGITGGVGSQSSNVQSGTSYTFSNSDCGKIVLFTNTSAVSATLPQAGSGGNFLSGCVIESQVQGNGTLTITPTTSTIYGQATATVLPSQVLKFESDGSNYGVLSGGSRNYKIGSNLEDPDGPLFPWYVSLANINNSQVKVLLIGDSIAIGLHTTSPAVNNSFYGYMRRRVSPLYPSKGDGFQYFPATAQSCTWSPTGTGNTCGWAVTGTWTVVPNWGLGFPPAQVRSAGSSATATLSSAYFDSIDIYYLTNTDSGSGFTVAIDGGSATTYGATTTGSLAWARQNITATLGTHSVVITAPSSGNLYLYAVSLNVSGTGGIQWHNTSATGNGANNQCNNPNSTQNQGWMSVMSPVPNLIIETLGTNDYAGTLANWRTDLDACLSFYTTTFPSAAILVIDMQNTNNATGGSGDPRSAYYAVTRQEADKFGAAYLNIGDRWGTFSNANSLGVQFDGTHPNSVGHWDIAEDVLKRIFPTQFSLSTLNSPVYNVLQGNQAGCSSFSIAPTVTLGPAANSTTTVSATFGASPSGGLCDLAGDVQINTTCTACTAGTASSEFLRVTFGTPHVNVPVCTLSPAGSQSAVLNGTQAVYFNHLQSQSTFASFYAGSTLPPNGQIMEFTFHCFGQ